MPESLVCFRNSVIQETVGVHMQPFRIIREIHGETGSCFFGVYIGARVPFKFNLLFIWKHTCEIVVSGPRSASNQWPPTPHSSREHSQKRSYGGEVLTITPYQLLGNCWAICCGGWVHLEEQFGGSPLGEGFTSGFSLQTRYGKNTFDFAFFRLVITIGKKIIWYQCLCPFQEDTQK